MSEKHLARCVFLDRLSIDLDDLDFSAIQAATQYRAYDQCSQQQIIERANNAEIVIVNKLKLDEFILSQLSALKLVCVIATGTNNIDIATANRLGIKVCNVKDYSAAAVSQHVFMLILALYTRFIDYQADIKQGKWQSQDQFCLLNHPIRELKGKTIGLIGYGHIAKAVEKIALAFDMKVIIAQSLTGPDQPAPGRLALKDVFEKSDIVSLHCPLTHQSRNLISAQQFEWMKNSAILINASRGGIVNEKDLIDAVTKGQIAGAAVDSIEQEPPSSDNPMLQAQAQLPQLIITPHNAWGAVEARQRLVDSTLANITAYLDNTLDQPGQIQSLTL
jgi:glycerate dehydrogenase